MSRVGTRLGFSATAILLLLGTTALAGNVHLKPPNSSPSFTDQGTTLNATGALAGLGSGDVIVNLSGDANATTVCTNPGGNQAPGQNPGPVSVTGSTVIPGKEIKNGNTTFTVTTVAPVSPIPGAPGCPNSGWTETITDLSFTNATIDVKQGGATQLSITCVFQPATSNGPVPKQTVTCGQ